MVHLEEKKEKKNKMHLAPEKPLEISSSLMMAVSQAPLLGSCKIDK